MSVIDTMRIRYMKGEPLLQAGDDFNAQELMEAMQTISDETKSKGLAPPVLTMMRAPGS